jgi:hypothetical protein
MRSAGNGFRRARSTASIAVASPSQVELIAQTRGNATFDEVLRKLKCSACGKPPPGPVYLCAGQSREFNWGAPPNLGSGPPDQAEIDVKSWL